MKEETKKAVNIAVDGLRNEGYAVLVILINQKPELRPDALEVLCSETNDPKILRAMLFNTLQILSRPEEAGRQN